jgi:chromosome segregation ATPase
VSSDAAETPGSLSEWQRLEAVLHLLLRAFDELRTRADTAEEQVKQLESALRNASPSGELDPLALANRVHLLEQENRFLARRLDRARDSVKRISARLQFLEDDR